MPNFSFKKKIKYIVGGMTLLGMVLFFTVVIKGYSNADNEDPIGSSYISSHTTTSARGCWTDSALGYGSDCSEARDAEDNLRQTNYSVCGTPSDPTSKKCTSQFPPITGGTLNCDECRWDPPGCTADDYQTCTYSACSNGKKTKTCRTKINSCTGTDPKTFPEENCLSCSGVGSGQGQYTCSYQYACTTNGTKTNVCTSNNNDCIAPINQPESCRDCTSADYANNCTYNYSQCRSQNGTKTKTCTLATTQCKFTGTFTSSTYAFLPEACRDCTADDYTSGCAWDYSKCQQTEKTKRQTCSLVTDQCKYTETFTSTSYLFPAENCRNCVGDNTNNGDYTLNCTEDTSTCSTTTRKSKTCGIATNQCRFTTSHPASTYTFTGIACTSCPDSSYTTDCVYDSQCLVSGANAGKVKKTCKKNTADCSDATRDFYETCPNCQYSSWVLDRDECDPTRENTPVQNGLQYKRTKNEINVSYCKNLALTESRACRECQEGDIYDCSPSSWNGIQCANGEKTRVCTIKTLAVGSPSCSLPTKAHQREITGNGTEYGQESLTTGCSSGAGSSLPVGQNGSTMIFINDGWAGSSFLFHKYAGTDRRIGIGTLTPNTTLEIVSPDTTRAAQVRITSTNKNPELQLQYGNSENRWGLYASNEKTTTPFSGEPITVASDKSLRIWGFGQDRVIIDKDGYVHAAKFCTNMDTDGCTGGSGDLPAADSAGNLLRSDGTNWASWMPDFISSPAIAGVSGQFLKITDNGVAWATVSDRVGSLSVGRIPKWGTLTLEDSVLIESGGKIGIGTPKPSMLLTIAGEAENPVDGECSADTEWFDENGNTTKNNGECKPSIAFNPDTGVLRITKGAKAGRVLVSDLNGNGTWKDFSALPTGVQGRVLWYNEGVWTPAPKLTIDKNGSVGIGAVTPAELETTRFAVKSNNSNSENKNGFFVSLQGSDTVISTTAPPSAWGVAISFAATGANDSFTQTEWKDGDVKKQKLVIKYYVSATGTKLLTNPIVKDEICSPTNAIPQAKDDKDNNKGDTNTNNKIDPGGGDPGKGATPAEWWVFTCTINDLTAEFVGTATSVTSKATVTADKVGESGTVPPAEIQWKAEKKKVGNYQPAGAPAAASAVAQPAAQPESTSSGIVPAAPAGAGSLAPAAPAGPVPAWGGAQ